MKLFIFTIVVAAVSAALTLRDVQDRPDALQGYFSTLMEIYGKLKEMSKFL